MSGKTRYVVRLFVGAAGLAVLLAGCSVPGGPSTSPMGSATPSPSETPTPTPDSGDPNNWLITLTSVGPVSVGDDINDVRAALVGFEEYGQDFGCPWVTYFKRDLLDLWIPVDDAEYRVVSEIVVRGDGPATVEGVHVGSSLDEVRAAYPDGTEGLYYDGLPYVSVTDGDGRWMHFATEADPTKIASIELSGYDRPASEFCG